VATQALRRTAELDALTGTLNRRSIDQWLTRQFASHSRERSLSLLFVDIDHFKRINDLYGHACGDHCLRMVAAALRTALRPQDVLGRYGGEEFIALLPECDVATARGAAERLRLAVEDCEIEWQGNRLRLSVSIGVATRDPGEQAAELLDRADRALYVAKRAGRNRVSVSPAVFPG
jgi:diguanylate cyclase (GGDEF)-like protein